MYRDIEHELIEWKDRSKHLPLLIRGARQVGKTFIVKKFAEAHFVHFVEVNFEYSPELKAYFDTLDPQAIVNRLENALGIPIIVGKTLLFLDEIQECKSAIMALRYFKERMPDLHVIAAGSLLEFVLENDNDDDEIRIPVGRVQYLYMKPMSFKGFLRAMQLDHLIKHIETITFTSEIDQVLHDKLLEYVRLYFVLGGMPAVIEDYIDNQSIISSQRIQVGLLNTYRDDFGKYARKEIHKYLERLYIKAPRQVGQTFKYVNIAKDVQSRDIKNALEKLEKAGLVNRAFATNASGLPLNATINERLFKLYFLDVGLLMASTEVDGDVMMAEDLTLINRGAIAEQFVCQELLALTDPYRGPNMFYWRRDMKNSMAEVDFVTNIGSTIIPIEVKSGKTGRLKSLRLFMEAHDSQFGMRISQRPLGIDSGIVSIPFYLISELSRLVNDV